MFRGKGGAADSLLFLAIAGVFLVLSATFLLWINEGRINFARIAGSSLLVDAEALPAVEDGTFVAVEGIFEHEEPLGDPPYLRPGPFISLDREVEVFAWIEERESGADQENPRPQDYSYFMGWTSEPLPTNEMAFPGDRQNPGLALSTQTIRTDVARLGPARFDPRSADLPAGEPLALGAEQVDPGGQGVGQGEFIYIGDGIPSEPLLGDIRIRYRAVRSGQRALLFAQKAGERLTPYPVRDDAVLFRLFFSGRSEAIVEMGQEYRFLRWGSRLFAILLLSVAFGLFLSPLSSAADLIPGLGTLGRGLVFVIAVGAALLYAALVSTVAFFYYNPLSLLIVLALLAMIGALIHALWRRSRSDAPN